VGSEAHLKVLEKCFTRNIILKLCRVRGRRIKDNAMSL
jgi:hypothetical protein